MDGASAQPGCDTLLLSKPANFHVAKRTKVWMGWTHGVSSGCWWSQWTHKYVTVKVKGKLTVSRLSLAWIPDDVTTAQAVRAQVDSLKGDAS